MKIMTRVEQKKGVFRGEKDNFPDKMRAREKSIMLLLYYNCEKKKGDREKKKKSVSLNLQISRDFTYKNPCATWYLK